MTEFPRRKYLAAIGASLAGAMAGCGEQPPEGKSSDRTGSDGPPSSGPTATTAATASPGPGELRLSGELLTGDQRLSPEAAALSGDIAIIGTRDIEGGRAVVFEADENGNWETATTLQPAKQRNYFGWEIELEGTTAAIGSFREVEEGEEYEAFVHIYVREDGEWYERQRLESPDTLRISEFGRELSLSDERLLVGGIGGGVAIHRRGDGWPRETVLESPRTPAGFGNTATMANGTAIIGMPGEEVDGVYKGLAFTYRRGDDGWRREEQLTAPDTDERVSFGEPLAFDGETLVVGAIYANPKGRQHAGAAYLFNRTDDGWEFQTKLVDNDGGRDSEFLFPSVLATGGGLVLGRDELDDNYGPGTVEVFSREGDEWVQHPSNLRPADDQRWSFGASLCIDDGRALVGAGSGGEPSTTPNDVGPTPENLDGGLPSAYVFEFSPAR